MQPGWRRRAAPALLGLCAAGVAACGPPQILVAGEQGPWVCSNGIDDDADGATDCDDSSCAGLWVCTLVRENTLATCVDGTDNDGDGRTDCEDPACIGISACAERSDTDCTNALDDDLDGFVDCSDPSCAGALSCLPPPPEDCGNGADDDGDGDADCMDADCSGDPGCAMAPALMPGECTSHLFTGADPDTAALTGIFGIAEAQLAGAMMAAKPAYGPYDLSGWGCRWFAVDVMVPAAGATLNAFSTDASSDRDYLAVCRLIATGALIGDDDQSGTDCSFFGSACGPLLNLDVAGRWTCFFSVSPFDVLGNGNAPTGGSLEACIN